MNVKKISFLTYKTHYCVFITRILILGIRTYGITIGILITNNTVLQNKNLSSLSYPDTQLSFDVLELELSSALT